jgi:NADP-dependent 3-hydroxy acid dehydrogenase YdfG
MMAKALDANGAAKVYILGRRMDKLEEVAKQAVTTLPFSRTTLLTHPRSTALWSLF